MKARIVWSALATLIALTLVLAFTVFRGSSDTERSVSLTMKDSGRTVQIHTGDTLVVTLDSNASTGFRWMLTGEPDAQVVSLLGSRYVEPATDLVGAGGQEVWRFRGVREGSTNLELTYERSWSGETAGRPFRITFEVASAG